MRALAAAIIIAITAASLFAQQPRRPAKAAPAAAPRREASVPFKPGETLTFDVSWSQFLTAATAVLKVVEKKPSFDSTAYYLVAEGQPVPLVARFYSLHYKMDSLLDSFSILSQYTALSAEEGARRHVASTRFDRAVQRAHYEVQGEPSSKIDFAIPANVQDGLAMVYALRARAFKAGEQFTIPLADNGALYTANFETLAPERVTGPLGNVDAWKLKIEAVDAERKRVAENVVIWFSNDARRLPLKLQADLPIGGFALTLREASGQ